MCELFLNVDCTPFTYDTPPAPIVLEAADQALKKAGQEQTVATADNTTITREEAMQNRDRNF